jgi:hypothetical protein
VALHDRKPEDIVGRVERVRREGFCERGQALAPERREALESRIRLGEDSLRPRRNRLVQPAEGNALADI